MKNKFISVIEWIIAILLIMICLNFSLFTYGSLTPLGAHEQSERGYYYGPSDILKTIDLGDVKLYLCRYKEWYSVSAVKKGLIKWYTAGEDIGRKIDLSLPINYGWGYSNVNETHKLNSIFGYVADTNISSVQVVSEDGKHIENYDLDQSRLFIFYWNGENQLYRYRTIRGLDKSGQEIYYKNLYD